MKFSMAIIIFFLAIVTLVAEFILYMIMGIGASFSGGIGTFSGTAMFFVSLMVLTGSTGILAPICAFIELIAKKKNIGLHVMLILLGLILIGLIFFNVLGPKEFAKTKHLQQTDSSVVISQEENIITKEKTAYYEKIIIRDVRVGKALDSTWVFGEIKNTGDKILKKVEITIYCLDAEGNPVFEKSSHPVSVSEWSSGDNESLKPNYSQKFGVELADAPSDWAEKVDIKITNVEFMD